MSELKPCPFCAGEVDFEITEHEPTQKGLRTEYRVQCRVCNAQGPPTTIDYQVKDLWNRRDFVQELDIDDLSDRIVGNTIKALGRWINRETFR